MPWVLCAVTGHDAPPLVIATLQSVKNLLAPDVPVSWQLAQLERIKEAAGVVQALDGAGARCDGRGLAVSATLVGAVAGTYGPHRCVHEGQQNGMLQCPGLACAAIVLVLKPDGFKGAVGRTELISTPVTCNAQHPRKVGERRQRGAWRCRYAEEMRGHGPSDNGSRWPLP